MIPLYQYFPKTCIPMWSCIHADDGFGNLIRIKLQAHDEIRHFLSQSADVFSFNDIMKAAEAL